MSAYTNINKPTGTPYTNQSKSSIDLNPYGTAKYGTAKYGQINAYTKIGKPVGGGLIWNEMNMAWSSAKDTWNGSDYINIGKPT